MKRIILLSIIALAVCVNLTLAETKESPAVKARASLENYFQAWNEPDATKREALLTPSWAEDGTYTDPTVHLDGRSALVNHIEGFISNPQSSKFSIERASEVDFHHNSFRFAWEMRDDKGNVLTPGIDYGEFNDEGQITKIVGFFGPMPKLK
jgi:hypothetical protein